MVGNEGEAGGKGVLSGGDFWAWLICGGICE